MSRFTLVTSLALTLFFVGCGKRESNVESGAELQILHKGNGTDPQGVDPHIVTGVPEHHIISAILEGLVAEDPVDLHPVPGTAERWEVSEDGLVYTFHFRKNAKWSNGDPVTTKDFMFSYQRILSPKLGAEYAYMMHMVKNAEEFNTGKITDFSQVGFKAIDDYTFEITLKNTTPYFISSLNHYSWFPVHPASVLKFGAMDDRSNSKWTEVENWVGNGPFTLEAWKVQHPIIVKKSETYWDKDTVRLDKIYFHPIEKNETEERDFRAGKLHVTNTMPLTKIDTYRKKYPELLHITTHLATYFYRLNVTKPPLNDPRVRRALALSVDQKAIVNYVTKGGQQPARNFVPPDTAGYTYPTPFEGGVEEARKLLAEAGFPNGENFPELEILYNTDEGHRQIAQAIQQMWKKSLNIKVAILNQEWKVYLDSQDQLDYEICRGGWTGDYPDPNTFMDMFVTNGGNNDTGWSNKEYDELIAKAAAAADQEERYGYFIKAEKILMDEMPIIPIYFYTRVYAKQPSVKNWHHNILDHHPFKHVYLESE